MQACTRVFLEKNLANFVRKCEQNHALVSKMFELYLTPLTVILRLINLV